MLLYISQTLTNQLKMQVQDGKLRATDVMDAEGGLQLIGLCPSPKAECFRKWVLRLVAQNKDVVKCVEEAAAGARDKVRNKVARVLLTVRRKLFCVLDEDREDEVKEDEVKGDEVKDKGKDNEKQDNDDRKQDDPHRKLILDGTKRPCYTCHALIPCA